MAIRSSRYYNDPAVGQAMTNIASLFAPPDSGDAANYALAKERNTRNDIVAQLRADPRYAGFDEQAILADLYEPTASFKRIEMDDATTRRGQDVTASTSLANNAADNSRAIITNAFQPLNQGQIRPAIPGAVAGQFGLPELGQVAGADKPLSETELDAVLKRELIGSGALQQDDIIASIMGGVPVENVVGPEGNPVIARRNEAVGQQPYFNKGAEAKPEIFSYATPDDRRGSAIYEDGKGLVDTQTGEVLPAQTKVYKASAQGTADEIGVGTTSNKTDAQRLRAAVSNANGIVNQLRTIVSENPATTGLAGDVISFAQDARQVLFEFGETFGKDENAPISAADLQAISDQYLGSGDYNPKFRQARALLLEFAYANATMNNPSGEVSRYALERELEALGQGLVGNDKGLLGVLDIAKARMVRKLDQANVLDGTAAALTPDQIGPNETPGAAGEEWVRGPDGKLVRAN